MSRSYRKTPISGITTAASDKEDKRICNRIWRQMIRQAIIHDHEVMPLQREALDVWDMSKDGKRWFGKLKHRGDTLRWTGRVTTAEEWREIYDRMMRK